MSQRGGVDARGGGTMEHGEKPGLLGLGVSTERRVLVVRLWRYWCLSRGRGGRMRSQAWV